MTREEKMKEKFEVMSAFEKECAEEGLPVCCGIDEAGRGPLAGPVVAAACILDPEKRYTDWMILRNYLRREEMLFTMRS